MAEERRSEWRLFRLWNVSREPKAFELHPPLDAHVSLGLNDVVMRISEIGQGHGRDNGM